MIIGICQYSDYASSDRLNKFVLLTKGPIYLDRTFLASTPGQKMSYVISLNSFNGVEDFLDMRTASNFKLELIYDF